jgi:ketosteroid isomerase-like protein
MNDMKVQRVQKIYKAFGEGDLPTILAQVADDVDWASEPESTIASWHGLHRGKAEVPRFFQSLASTIDVLRFDPLTFVANDTDVLVVIRFGPACAPPIVAARWTFTIGGDSVPTRSSSIAERGHRAHRACSLEGRARP